MKYRYRTERKVELDANKIIIVSIIAASIAIAAFLLSDQQAIPMPILTSLSTAGYQQVAVDAAVASGYGVVGMESECYQIIASVEDYQAESILNGLEKSVPERPNAHDIAADAFANLEIELLMVKISDVKDGTFYSKIILRNGNRIAELDARPSDAVAIALRMDVPVYVSNSILEEYGEYIC